MPLFDVLSSIGQTRPVAFESAVLASGQNSDAISTHAALTNVAALPAYNGSWHTASMSPFRPMDYSLVNATMADIMQKTDTMNKTLMHSATNFYPASGSFFPWNAAAPLVPQQLPSPVPAPLVQSVMTPFGMQSVVSPAVNPLVPQCTNTAVPVVTQQTTPFGTVPTVGQQIVQQCTPGLPQVTPFPTVQPVINPYGNPFVNPVQPVLNPYAPLAVPAAVPATFPSAFPSTLPATTFPSAFPSTLPATTFPSAFPSVLPATAFPSAFPTTLPTLPALPSAFPQWQVPTALPSIKSPEYYTNKFNEQLKQVTKEAQKSASFAPKSKPSAVEDGPGPIVL